MSSGFISSGKIEGQDPSRPLSSVASPTPLISHPKNTLGKNQDAWDQVQKEVVAERQQRAAERAKAINGEEKSLYEILQANKAAKQAAIEEQNRLSNQFRALDDDEVEFLDRVRDSKRSEDNRVREETQAELQAFRHAQQSTANESQKSLDGGDVGETDWALNRKKRKAKSILLRNVKHKTEDYSATEGKMTIPEGKVEAPATTTATTIVTVTATLGTTSTTSAKRAANPTIGKVNSDTNPQASIDTKLPHAKPALIGLVDYGSDSE
ncbi:hypothetical protein Cpir12675_000142 [Ceratocystis pirilliformis]|uniref:FAM192A/Fyv6 N-terminal domain-containing protein n=1 Tax=Ceratocystis pirilliformis TaxID=259994 RepID=A0ABR3ZPL4_9PEZI